MKKYTKDDIKFIEYAVEDWNNGSFTKMKIGEEIKTVIRTNGEKEKICFYLPPKEHEKIEQRKKDLFEERAGEYFERLKTEFNKRVNNSREKETLLNREVELYESLISAENIFVPPYDLEPQKTPIEGIQYNSRGINGIRKAYKERIIDGNIGYEFVTRNSFNPYLLNPSPESCIVIAESVYKYVQWLKTAKDTRQTNVFDELLTDSILKAFFHKNRIEKNHIDHLTTFVKNKTVNKPIAWNKTDWTAICILEGIMKKFNIQLLDKQTIFDLATNVFTFKNNKTLKQSYDRAKKAGEGYKFGTITTEIENILNNSKIIICK